MFLKLLSIFIDVVTPVFALVLLGYIAGPKLKLQSRTLSRIAYYLFIPAFIFNIIGRARIEAADAVKMIIYAVVVHLLLAALAYLLAWVLRRPKEMRAAYVMIAIFGNVGNFGLSLIEFRLGEASRVPATVFFLAILMISFVVCVGIASWTKGGGISAVWSVFKTPALLAFIPALAVSATQTPIPLSISRATGLLGNAMIPVMLVTLGVQLAEVSKITFSFDVVMASMVRLVAGPAVAALLVGFFGFTGLTRGAGILQAAMPAAVLTSIIAIEHELVPEFVTTSVLFSTLASLLTLTVVLSLV